MVGKIAAIIEIAFVFLYRLLAVAALMAVAAVYNAREGINRFLSGGLVRICIQYVVNQIKIISADNSFVSTFLAEPVFLRSCDRFSDLVIGPVGLSLNHRTSIYFIFKDTPYCSTIPLRCAVDLESSFCVAAAFLFVPDGCGHLHLV